MTDVLCGLNGFFYKFLRALCWRHAAPIKPFRSCFLRERKHEKRKNRRKAAAEKKEETENHKESFLHSKLSLVEQTERVFLLQAASPLRVTGQLTNKHQHKTPSKPRGGRTRETGEADARPGSRQMGPDES